MKDNLSIVITMLVFVILIVIFPLYNYFERQDDMSYNLALKATTNFVDEVLESGYITQEMYSNFVNELSNTGNIYDIELEAHKKILTSTNDVEYDEQYKIEYNKDILADNLKATDVMNTKVVKDEAYYLNEGDQFYVKMKNSNTTMAAAIFNTIVPTASKDRIVVNYGGVVKNASWAKVDAKYYDLASIVKNSPDVYKYKLDGVLFADEDKYIDSNEILLYPGTNSTLTLKASGPNTTSWWNKISGYTWTSDCPGITSNGDTCEIKTNSLILPLDVTRKEYNLEVRAIDSVGNTTDPENIKIIVTQTITGGTGQGGFNDSQTLDIITGEFLNAYPKALDLSIWLGNRGHAYSGDLVRIYGIKSDGTEEIILNNTMGNLIGNRTYNGVVVKGTTSKENSYTYTDGKEYEGKGNNGVFKIVLNIDFSSKNSDKRYKKIRIYYYNQHENCVLNLPNGIGGAYDYTVTYGT